MKELDASIINAVDLDVPRDQLTFRIIQHPKHGAIMVGLHGNDVAHYRRSIQSHGKEVQVQVFTMEDLRNGTQSWNEWMSQSINQSVRTRSIAFCDVFGRFWNSWWLFSQVWHWCICMMTQRLSRTASSSSCLMESTSSKGTYWLKWCLSMMRSRASLGIWYKRSLFSF